VVALPTANGTVKALQFSMTESDSVPFTLINSAGGHSLTNDHQQAHGAQAT
jgi:hypothetical protein